METATENLTPCHETSPGVWCDIVGSEAAFPSGRSRRLECSDGSVIVNGVRLPAIVVHQLEALGMPLEAYSPGELEDAVVAIEDDGTLLEDDEGQTFEDRLHLSDEEKRLRAERREAYRLRNVVMHQHLYSDISDATPEQLHNPWFEQRQTDTSERDDADRFQIVHFGHEGLFDFMQQPPPFEVIAPHMQSEALQS